MLTDLPSRFINYRRQWDSAKQKWQKIPCDSQGHSIDPHTPDKWRAYDDAAEYALWDESQPDKPYGVGFVLNGDGWFFYDLDACLDTTTKQWEAWADLTCRTFNGAYGEVSTSGKEHEHD